MLLIDMGVCFLVPSTKFHSCGNIYNGVVTNLVQTLSENIFQNGINYRPNYITDVTCPK